MKALKYLGLTLMLAHVHRLNRKTTTKLWAK